MPSGNRLFWKLTLFYIFVIEGGKREGWTWHLFSWEQLTDIWGQVINKLCYVFKYPKSLLINRWWEHKISWKLLQEHIWFIRFIHHFEFLFIVLSNSYCLGKKGSLTGTLNNLNIFCYCSNAVKTTTYNWRVF